jgi:hypothetical protein
MNFPGWEIVSFSQEMSGIDAFCYHPAWDEYPHLDHKEDTFTDALVDECAAVTQFYLRTRHYFTFILNSEFN